MTFEDKEYNKKIQTIRKYYKNDKLFLETYFDNYNGFNIYIRIDYVSSDKCYKLRWFDLDYVKTSKISKYVSSEYIEDEIVLGIKELVSEASVPNEKYSIGKDNNVSVLINSACKNSKNFNIKFYRYLPEDIEGLDEVFDLLFMSLPKKLEPFLDEVLGNNVSDIEYEKKFRFDLFNDDIFELFDEEIINRGESYYQEKKVIFLEKIGDRYFSVVSGNELYVVVIKYDEISHDMQVFCSCPCEFFCKHVYAVIRAIREKKFNPFYKIMVKSEYEDMFERLMDFNYSLSIGVVDDVIGVIGDNGEIEWKPILDDNGKTKWVIVEDDQKNSLVKSITSLIEKK